MANKQCYICDKDQLKSKGPMMPWRLESGGTVEVCTSCYNDVTGKNLQEQQEQIQEWREERKNET